MSDYMNLDEAMKHFKQSISDFERRANAEGYCPKCSAPMGISGQCASCAIDDFEKAHQSEEDILRAQLRKISWIVRKPRHMSKYLNETELLRAIVEEVRATFNVPPKA